MSLVQKIVSPLSTQALAVFAPSAGHYDYAIGGLPFMSGIGSRLGPYTIADFKRQTAPFRKDQVDQSAQVGEQSLQGWWLRSQSSFHGGAGQEFLDGNGDNSTYREVRFHSSRGVNVWTPGQVTVLPQPQALVASVNVALMIPANAGAMYVVGTSLYYRPGSGGIAPVVVAYGGTGAIKSLTSDGTNYYVSSASGVYRGPLDNSSGGTQAYNTTTPLVLAYVKSRLMGAAANVLYELSPTATAAALPTAFYTHPNVAWSWTSFAEGPQGIYAGGVTATATKSFIYRIGISIATGTPVLSAPVQVVELPDGETLVSQGLLGYAGTYLAMGTTRGVRVGLLQSDGSVQTGSFTVTGPMLRGPGSSFTFGGFAVRDRFLFVATKGTSPSYPNEAAVLRIDLSTQTSPGVFAWASDQATNVTTVTAAAVVFDVTGNILLGTTGGLYATTTTAEPLTFLLSSKIRYSTSDPKVFERVRTECDGASTGNGYVVTHVVDASGVYPSAFGQFTPSQGRVNEWRIEDSYHSKSAVFLQVELDMFESTNVTTPDLDLRSYQLKALPAQKRQRLMQIPLLCFDNERDLAGNRLGGDSSAFGRLAALEALEEAGAPVTFQRFGPDGLAADSRAVVIDDVMFVQTGSPNSADSWGGVILVTVRTVD